jgi:hypothetical protein
MRQKSQTVYQLKIALLDIRPQIWRQVVVPADIRLDRLHIVFQAALGWTNSHLHSFGIGETEYSMPYEEGDLEELTMEDEQKVRLNDLVTEVKAHFGYDYDFGDSWQHLVTVEKILSADPDVRYPVCLAGNRSCPPEDCGGVWGYAELLKVFKNPKHPEYKDMKEWVGRRFDPEAFDLERINKELVRLRV